MILLILGHTIPEPTTTAAGSRMVQLITLFQEEGYTIHFATSALPNPRSLDLISMSISLDVIQLNDPSFDKYIVDIDPDVVLYDRFIIEEHYGWRVAQCCPRALRILDTEDLHFLRKAREKSIKSVGDLSEVDLYNNETKRELASIMRCDISFIISSYEMQLLTDTFGVSESQLHYLPFWVESTPSISTFKPFAQRDGFMTIGNLFHAPNVDSILYLKKRIWPKLKEQLPTSTLSIYGNYAPQQINELHNVKEGFLIKGWAPSVADVMSASKVCLVPLRFGAGLKGKLLDAMLYGTPSVTSRVGGEGMYGKEQSNFVVHTDQEMIQRSISIYTSQVHWEKSQKIGVEVLRDRYLKNDHAPTLKNRISVLLGKLNAHRKANFIGQILHHQTLQSTKYMSKWIEEKNK